ncbi:MAG: hypothetical protein AAF614_23885 [Chloroflexota bacterium]
MSQHDQQARSRVIWIILFATIGFTLFALQSALSLGTLLAKPAAETAVSATENTNDLANCRYGVAPVAAPHTPWVENLGAGWYLEFFAKTIPDPPANNAEFFQVIRIHQNKTETGEYLPGYTTTPPLGSTTLDNHIMNNPGSVWIVGNEVDRGPNDGDVESLQDDTFPEVYAQAYHDTYEYIKQRDPSARIANSGLVQVTPGRLQYLDLMWQAHIDLYGYPMSVDIWNIHLYILPELDVHGNPNGIANVALGTDPSLGRQESGGNANLCGFDTIYCFAEHDDINVFAQQVRAMRQWMKDHGQQNKPLILSEYSLLFPYIVEGDGCFLQDEFGNCFTPERVQQFMQASFSFLENARDPELGFPLDDDRLVQQWLWFAGNSPLQNDVSDLVNDDLTELLPLGEMFRAHVEAQPVTRNLFVEKVNTSINYTPGLTETETVTATLSVDIRNKGNHSVDTPYTVSFFADAAMTMPIGSTVVNPVQRGCALHGATAMVEWPGLAPGKHSFWVLVDSEDVVVETPANNIDNQGVGFVLVDPQQISLPIIRK